MNTKFTGRFSTFKNLYGEGCKKELYFTNLNIHKSSASAESCVLAASDKCFALPWATNSGIAVIKHADVPDNIKARKAPATISLLTGHNGLIHDIAFNPVYNSRYPDKEMLASAGADGSVKIWKVKIPDADEVNKGKIHCTPMGDTSKNAEDLSLLTLLEHTKKVHLVHFHRFASELVVSASLDNTVKLWDLRKQSAKITIPKEAFDDSTICSMDWNMNGGDTLLTSCRDTMVRIFDPRDKSMTAIVQGQAHEGKKGFRSVWLGTTDMFFTVGFNSSGQRQYALWDLRKGMKRGSIVTKVLTDDNSSSQLFPFIDEGTNLIYLCGKGDNKIRVLEVDMSESPFLHAANDFTDTKTTMTGMSMLPKKMCDFRKNEISRFMILNNDVVQSCSIFVPRKTATNTTSSEILFQEDLYQPVLADEPLMTSEEWFSGVSKQPVLKSLQPTDMKSIYEVSEQEGGRKKHSRSNTLQSALLNFSSSPTNSPVTSTSSASDGIAVGNWLYMLDPSQSNSKWIKVFAGLSTRDKNNSQFVYISGKESTVRSGKGASATTIADINSGGTITVNFTDGSFLSAKGSKGLRDDKFSDDQCFQFMVHYQNKLYALYFAAASLDERDYWVETIQREFIMTMEAIKKSRKTQNNVLMFIPFEDYFLELSEATDDSPIYWRKRWYVIIDDILYVFASRKSLNPIESYLMNPDLTLTSKRPRILSLDSSSTVPGVTLYSEEKNLCIRLQFTTNLKDGHSKYILCTSDAQKEAWTELILNKCGLSSLKSLENDNEDELLDSLGLSDKKDSNRNSLRKSNADEDDGPGQIDIYPISSNFTSDDVASTFQVFGTILTIDLQRNGKFKDHAFITYKKKADAEQALCLNSMNLDGHVITVAAVSQAEQKERTSEPGYLKIESVSHKVTNKDFLDLFEMFGEVEMLKLWMNGNNNSQTGYIKFSTHESAEQAQWMSGSKLYGEAVIVKLLSGNELPKNQAQEEALFTNQVDPTKVKQNQQKVLLQIKGKKKIRSRQVPIEFESINSGDVFVLDCGKVIYQWNGSKASKFKKARGLDVSTNLRVKERGGNAKVYIIDEIDPEETPEKKEFWTIILHKNMSTIDKTKPLPPPHMKIADAKQGRDDLEFEQWIDSKTKLYRIGYVQLKEQQKLTLDANDISATANKSDVKGRIQVKVVHEGSQPSKSLFKTEYVYLLDCFSELFIWEGKESLKEQREFAKKFAIKMETGEKRPTWTSTTKVIENGEPVIFKEKLSDYGGVLPIAVGAAEKHKGNVANKVEQKPIDPVTMYQMKPESEPMFGNDNMTDNKIQIWRVDGFDKVVYPSELYGQFFSGDSFVIQVSFKKNTKDYYIIYFWQGRDSSINEKGASALLTIDVSTEVGDAPQIRITQHHETKHFLALFKGFIVIHNGKFVDRDKKKNSARLFDVRSLSTSRDLKQAKTRVIETYDISKDQLNSNHVSLALSADQKTAYIWKGKYSDPAEVKVASDSLSKILKTKPVVKTVEQGEENDEFFKLLNVNAIDRIAFKKQVKSVEEQGYRQMKRLYEFSGATGAVTADRTFTFCQEDLDNSKVMMLDVDHEVFLWFGTTSTHIEQKIAIETAVKYVQTDKKYNDNIARVKDIEQRMYIVRPCQEPAQFTCHFQAWGPYRDRTMKEIAEQIAASNQQGSDERKKNTKLETVSERLKEFSRTIFAYQELLRDPLPNGVDPTILETYLSDEEFKQVFEMTREVFNKLPKWKQDSQKKQVYLF